MKKNKFIPLALLVLLGTSTLTGCKSVKAIEFWHSMGQDNQVILNRMIEKFQTEYSSHPLVSTYKILHHSVGGYPEVFDKINKAIPANGAPTMAYVYPDHVATYLDSKNNVVADLNQFIDDPILGFTEEEGSTVEHGSGVDDFVDNFWEEGTAYKKEGVFSAPFLKSTEVMFYNKTVLGSNQAKQVLGTDFDPENIIKWENLDDPNDFTALLNVARVAKETGFFGSHTPGDRKYIPIAYDSDSNLFITFCQQLGIDYTSWDNSLSNADRLLFDNPEAKAMVEKIKGWYDTGLLRTKDTSSGAYSSTAFANREVLFMISSTGGTSYAQTTDVTGVKPIPQWDQEHPYCIQQGPSISIFNQSSEAERELAWLFYKFLTRADNSAIFASSTGYEPVRYSSFETDIYVTHMAIENNPQAALHQYVANVTSELKDWYFTTAAFRGSTIAREQVGGIITSYLLGQRTLDQAFDHALNQSRISAGGN